MERIFPASVIIVLSVTSAIPSLVAYKILNEGDIGSTYEDPIEDKDVVELEEYLKADSLEVMDVSETIKNAKDPSHRKVVRSNFLPRTFVIEDLSTSTFEDRSREEYTVNRGKSSGGRKVLEEDNSLEDKRVRSARPRHRHEDLLSSAELSRLWLNFGIGKVVDSECPHLPHLEVQIRCSGNVQEVTVQLDEEEEEEEKEVGQVTIHRANNSLFLRGGKKRFYAILPRGAVGGSPDRPHTWHLTEGLTSSDITDCTYCGHVYYVIIIQLKGGIQRFRGGRPQECSVRVECRQPGNVVRIRMQDTALQKAFGLTRVSHVARVAMDLRRGNKDIASEAQLPEGTEVTLRLSVMSPQVNIHMYVLNCEARLHWSKVLLARDGCNKNLLGRFRETLENPGDEQRGSPRLLVLEAKLRLINTAIVQQKFLIVCKVKICGGTCPEKSTCAEPESVTTRQREFTKDTLLSEVVELKKGVLVSAAARDTEEIKKLSDGGGGIGGGVRHAKKSGLAQKSGSEFVRDLDARSMEDGNGEADLTDGGGSDNNYDDPPEALAPPRFVLQPKINHRRNERCIPESYFFSVIGIICGVFLVLLIVCVYLIRLFALHKIEQICWEVESPSKPFYSDYIRSSPRLPSNISNRSGP